MAGDVRAVGNAVFKVTRVVAGGFHIDGKHTWGEPSNRGFDVNCMNEFHTKQPYKLTADAVKLGARRIGEKRVTTGWATNMNKGQWNGCAPTADGLVGRGRWAVNERCWMAGQTEGLTGRRGRDSADE